jgi:uncharacterized sporulation protein YeaH/YhbH (DUF444 family)
MNIIDRRLNPQGKSLANRQRFIRRARKQIADAVREASGKSSVADMSGGGKIKIRSDGINEPQLYHSGKSGEHTHVVPGNHEYVEGDRIPRPQGGEGGRGREASADGEGEDAFQFVLTQDEFLDLFLEDLELPDLLRKQLKKAESFLPRRAGYSVSGAATNLNLVRTMRNSLSRRIALKRPRPAEIAALEGELKILTENGDDIERCRELELEIEQQRRRSRRVPFIDPVDVRYNRFELVPQPVASAVMFCLMDVSGSMTEHMKDLAKRFYKLLYLFLSRRYRNVEIVFIRHTHVAREVDEETFFNSRETGGTVVSTVLEEMLKVLQERYPRDQWNIYAAQASDGDNLSSDNAKSAALLEKRILPLCQYFAYLEVGDEEDGFNLGSEIWRTYERLDRSGHPIAMRKVNKRNQIFPVFRELFARDQSARKAAS